MHFSLHPEHEGQEEVSHLDDAHEEQVPLDGFVVPHHVHLGHLIEEEVLDGLPCEVNGVVEEERERAVIRDEDEAEQQTEYS
jgi:hypothetical protein